MRLMFQLASCMCHARRSVPMDRRGWKKIGGSVALAFLILLPQMKAHTSPLDQARSLVAARSSPDEAKSLLAKIIASDPKNAEAHFLLGEILYAFADYQQASEQAQEALALDDTK